MAYARIKSCRVCGNTNLIEVLDLGEQALTGFFPSTSDEYVPSMPLTLVKCHGGSHCCQLLQLAYTYPLEELYGNQYGYRSGLNEKVVSHLKKKVEEIESFIALSRDDLVLDIGSNDGTTLGFYAKTVRHLVGIDPTATKFRHFYPKHAEVVSDFFTKDVFVARYGEKKAKVITSFSMFYDLPNPIQFSRDIASILHPQGIWVLEQSYMPSMLKTLSYDTVCHEHLEYYGLKQIKWILDKVGLDIIDVSFNTMNGGSFSVVVAHSQFVGKKHLDKVNLVLNEERKFKNLTPYENFRKGVQEARSKLLGKLRLYKRQGKKVIAIGASTKGNVILQYCGIDKSLVSLIGEVNEDKFDRYTPGTNIPIQPQNDALALAPDFVLILPWHLWQYFEEHPVLSHHRFIHPIATTEK